MKIQVTQQDIDEGVAESCHDCPVALAIERATLGDVRVWRREVSIYKIGRKPLPLTATDFIDHFDAREPVQPFEFELDITPNPRKSRG
jgi:hypothetical protein